MTLIRNSRRFFQRVQRLDPLVSRGLMLSICRSSQVLRVIRDCREKIYDTHLYSFEIYSVILWFSLRYRKQFLDCLKPLGKGLGLTDL
jgi:hypothetical protein